MSLRADVRCSVGDFSVEAAIDADPGSPVALVGPNGAGKTTLVRALAGLTPLERGVVTLDGNDVTHLAARDRSIGVVFQERALFERMSATENVAFGLRARGVRASDARRRARDLLRSMDLEHRADARPRELSGGEAQRVAIARALAHEPRVLLLDEPLSSLDVRARTEVRALLAKVLANFGGDAIIVTHDPVDALTLTERIVVLENGRVSQSGSVDEIRSAPRTSYAAELVGMNLFVGRLDPIGDGAAELHADGGVIIVSCPAEVLTPVDHVTALLRPADIVLHREQPSSASARNVVRGVIRSISDDGARARIRIDSPPPLIADVTPGSVARLGLSVGESVWASFKAVEVRVLLHG
ncbi:MAG TPA: ABC transporter ATP-binding protein [Actinomycetota bacterium]|nr:ABC transporter ATP-binding protein [Actinomycetota bacterium]